MTYGAILIDPPWAFRTFGGDNMTPHRSAEDHYKTMKAHEIAGLPIPDLAAKSCVLFMWTVDSHLDESLDLMRFWGFKYKTIAFIWEKLKDNQRDLYDPPPCRIGMGYWTRKQAEICIMGTRGTPKRLSKGVRQIIQSPRREHSRKPDETYSRIEALVEGPYLEMFARQKWNGWDGWGNETEKFKAAE